jgi:Na+-transporting NADH:ubiquinone oxidoreductase subunit NqrE
MLLKVIIIILFIGVIASLFGGLNFLVKDMGNSNKRLLYALGIRIGLASVLIACVIYGVSSGQLNSTAPWDHQLHPENVTPYQPATKE